jgi:hypothetical protein
MINREKVQHLVQQVGTDTSGKWINVDRMNQFAELIVNECEQVSLNNSHRDDDMGAIIARNIKRNFGVEE